MTSNKKKHLRLVSIVLTAMMLLSAMPMSVLAENTDGNISLDPDYASDVQVIQIDYELNVSEKEPAENASSAENGDSTTESALTADTEYNILEDYEAEGYDGEETATDGVGASRSLPVAPEALTASKVTGNSITLTWTTDTPHYADRWLVEYKVNSGDWEQLGTSTYTGYYATGLKASTLYQFRVCSESGSPKWQGTHSAYTNIVSVTTLPAQPTGLTVKSFTDNRISITWSTAAPHGADRWLVEYSVNGGEWTHLGTSTYKGFVAVGLKASTAYRFRVYGERGSPAWSGTRSLVSNTVSVTMLPAQPTNLTVNSCTSNRISISWSTASPHGADRWLVEYSVNGGEWTRLGTSTYKGFVATGLMTGIDYKFRVYGERGSPAWSGTKSPVSSTLSVTTLCEPALQNILNNITATNNISNEKKDACKLIATLLYNEGYELAFMAGLMSNIQSEGSVGLFEYYNENNPTPYIYNFNKYLSDTGRGTYTNLYAGRYIYNGISVNGIYEVFSELAAMGWHISEAGYLNTSGIIFNIGAGIGCVGWTFDRAYTLIGMYKKYNGGGDTITETQCLKAEADMTVQELTGNKKTVYDDWKSGNSSNLNSANAAYNAGYIICYDYESPYIEELAFERGNLARLIYTDLIQ